MTSPEPPGAPKTTMAPDLTTTAADYDEQYYRTGLGPAYDESEPHWAAFFGALAKALVEQVAPVTALDAGCAKGFLVKALLDEGVDAYGVDVSGYAISEAPPAVAGRVGVHDLTQPLEASYDLITCIEVLEHMAPADAELAIDNMCRASSAVLLSSTPHDFVEPTHVNVRPVADWVATFARRGFYRRMGTDLTVLSPWAVIFERRTMTTADVARMYEVEAAPIREEAVVKSHALLDTQRRLDELSSDVPIPGGANQLDRVLGLLDQVIGLQAELAEARFEAEAATALYREHDRRPAVWSWGQSHANLETALALEQELRQALERRAVDLQARAERAEHDLAELRGSRPWRAASVASRAVRAGRRAVTR